MRLEGGEALLDSPGEQVGRVGRGEDDAPLLCRITIAEQVRLAHRPASPLLAANRVRSRRQPPEAWPGVRRDIPGDVVRGFGEAFDQVANEALVQGRRLLHSDLCAQACLDLACDRRLGGEV